MSTNNYNFIAKYYDTLGKIVYGNTIKKAQQFLIDFINDNDRILIVGGGTGWILKEIAALKKQDIIIEYVEKSEAMINLSRQKNFQPANVVFINKAIEDYTANSKFDVILTPFLFDNFKEEKIRNIFLQLDNLLKENGLWLYADFVNDDANKKTWQQFLLKMMYLFFKLTAKIETQKLTDMRSYFVPGYKLIKENFFYGEFIQSLVYKKK